MTDGDQNQWGDHIVTQKNVKSVYRTPETDITHGRLSINYKKEPQIKDKKIIVPKSCIVKLPKSTVWFSKKSREWPLLEGSKVEESWNSCLCQCKGLYIWNIVDKIKLIMNNYSPIYDVTIKTGKAVVGLLAAWGAKLVPWGGASCRFLLSPACPGLRVHRCGDSLSQTEAWEQDRERDVGKNSIVQYISPKRF